MCNEDKLNMRNGLLSLTNMGMVFIVCMALSGCDGNSVTVWSAAMKSPNGDWVAQAHTLQSSGFGTAATGTGVYLRRTESTGAPIQVLGLSNKSAYPVGITSVKLRWVTNSHLDVTYGCGAKLNFQDMKAGGVRITVHKSCDARHPLIEKNRVKWPRQKEEI